MAQEKKTGDRNTPQSPWWPLTCKPGCVYRAGDGGCSYIFIEGRSRGCDPGRDCIRYTRARKTKKQPAAPTAPVWKEERPKRSKACGWDNVKGFELYTDEGLNCRQIADRLGTSKSAVMLRKREHWDKGEP